MLSQHIPVMVEEVVRFLRPASGVYADLTVGGGGHAHRILSAARPDARLLALDLDDEAIARARQRLRDFGDRVTFVREDFRHLDKVLADLSVERLHGVLIDPGPSLDQLKAPDRGFSFDSPCLDMRYDRRRERTAADAIAELSQDDLAAVIRQFGDEGRAAQIAAEIAQARQRRAISDGATLAAHIAAAVGRRRRGDTGRAIRPETRTFMALRRYLNDEPGALSSGIRTAAAALVPQGRICVLTYHSLEDRIAKRELRDLEKACVCPPQLPVCQCGRSRLVRVLTRRPLRPTEEEVQRNYSARSAKLRVAERCPAATTE